MFADNFPKGYGVGGVCLYPALGRQRASSHGGSLEFKASLVQKSFRQDYTEKPCFEKWEKRKKKKKI